MSDFDIIKEEYLILRKEIETHQTELGQLEKNCVLVSAAIYAWLAKDGINSSIAPIGWYIPILFSFFGVMRSFALGVHLKKLGGYILEIENACLVNENKLKGWEHYQASTKSLPRITVRVSFWLVFFVVTISIGILNEFQWK